MNTDSNCEEEIKFEVRENMSALVCGAIPVGFALVILFLHLRYPSGRGGAFLYVPLLGMAFSGAAFWLLYFHTRLSVDGMEICYVNWLGKEKHFTLDEIGFCRIGLGGNKNMLVVYDLLGKKLCKLDFDMMKGIEEFHQYLLDNRVEIEWAKGKTDRGTSLMVDLLQQETAVCGEEIRKYTESFYGEAEQIFREWEKRNKKFQARWEIGFAEYQAADLEQKCRPWERASSVEEPLTKIPASYQCVLEAYLKRGEEYIVNRQGREIVMILPYFVRTKSYQIGEGTRIRKMGEESIKNLLEAELEALARELPRRRYHTEALVLRHRLSPSAGIAAK